MSQPLLTFLKFGLVGISGLIIDFGLTWVTKEKARWSPYLANAVGFLFAASSNWYLNRIWSFESKNSAMLLEYTNFIGIAMLGLGINSAVLYIGIKRFHLPFYFSKIIAIAITTFWNFFANYFYTFA